LAASVGGAVIGEGGELVGHGGGDPQQKFADVGAGPGVPAD
jgi:hypothetical protein